MRILITGGAGFIGSHVADAFLAAGHTVYVFDNLSTGKRENVPSGATLIVGDLTDAESINKAIAEVKPDVVDHHAAQISVTASVKDPVHDATTNILGTLNLLQAVVTHAPQAKLIYASSGGAMYGIPEEQPYAETSTAQAAAPYGLSKYVAEQYVWLYARLHGLRATVLRYANVYGPRQDPHGEAGVCAIFAERMHAGDPVTIYGDGSAVRDYVFVGDVAAANVAVLENGTGESFNICTGIPTSTQTVYETFKQAMGYALDAAYQPLRAGEAVRSLLSPTKAERDLSWKASVSFGDGVEQTATWYADSHS